MAQGLVDLSLLEEIGGTIRNLGYPQYTGAQKFTIGEKEGTLRLNDIIQHIGQLNLVNSISQEKLALEDIQARCFVTEKTSVTNSEDIIISESGALLIRGQQLSDNTLMEGWIEELTHRLYVRILKKTEEGGWSIKTVKQIAVDSAQGFDLIKINANVVVIGYTTDMFQGFLRLDINNDIIREHGNPTILNNVGYKNIKLWIIDNSNNVEFGFFLWGYNDGKYGRTISNSLRLDPYDVDPSGNTQVMKDGKRPLHVQEDTTKPATAYISYTHNGPHALWATQLTANEIFIVRIGANYNIITEIGRNRDGVWWVIPLESAQGSVNGATAITAVIATPTKAVVCYNGQNAVWGVVAPMRSNQRPNHVKLLDGNFERINLIKIDNDTYWLSAYGKGDNSAQSKLLKVKVDIQNNTFSTIYEDAQPGLENADMVLLDNINAVICANKYNAETQNSKLIGQSKKLGLGVAVAQEGDNIVGVSSSAALQGNYIFVETVRPQP